MDPDINKTLLLAVEAHKADRFQDAEYLYRNILALQPSHPDANHNLGVLLAGLGRDAEALPLLKLALESLPTQGQFWVSYINALIGVGQLAVAREVLRQGLGIGLNGSAVSQIEQRLTREEVVHYQQRHPSQSEIEELLTVYKSANIQKAEELGRRLIESYPRHPFGWKALGVIAKSLGRLEEAVDCLTRALQISPEESEAHNNLGATLRELGRLAVAELSCKQAILLKPNY